MTERGRPRNFDRAAALRQAMELFWVKGYEGASISDLTTAMGIGSPSLYAAFGCKEALFREAIELYGRTEGAELWSVVETAVTARKAIEGWLVATADMFTRPDRPTGCLIVLSALHATEASQTVTEELRRHRAETVARLEARLIGAIAAGELPAGLVTRAVATFYVTVQQGMSIQARDGASRQTLAAVARTAMAAWEPLARLG